MLDKQVTAYLRERPGVLTALLNKVLATPMQSSPVSFASGRGKKARPEKGEPDKRPRVDDAGNNEDMGWNDLVDDTHNLILDRLVQEARTDDRVLLDLIIFALVSKGVGAKVAERLAEAELCIDSVGLCCRALFEYFAYDHATFELFRHRVERYAKATEASWCMLLADERRATAFRDLVVHMRFEKPRHFAHALNNNGRDPMATALVLHDLAFPDVVVFTPSDISDLREQVFDTHWLALMSSPKNSSSKVRQDRVQAFYLWTERYFLQSNEFSYAQFHAGFSGWRPFDPKFKMRPVDVVHWKSAWKRLLLETVPDDYLRILMDMMYVVMENVAYVGKPLAYLLVKDGLPDDIVSYLTTWFKERYLVVVGREDTRLTPNLTLDPLFRRAFLYGVIEVFVAYDIPVDDFRSLFDLVLPSGIRRIGDKSLMFWYFFQRSLKHGCRAQVDSLMEILRKATLDELRFTIERATDARIVKKHDRDGAMQTRLVEFIASTTVPETVVTLLRQMKRSCISDRLLTFLRLSSLPTRDDEERWNVANIIYRDIVRADSVDVLVDRVKRTIASNSSQLLIAVHPNVRSSLSRKLVKNVENRSSIDGLLLAESAHDILSNAALLALLRTSIVYDRRFPRTLHVFYKSLASPLVFFHRFRRACTEALASIRRDISDDPFVIANVTAELCLSVDLAQPGDLNLMERRAIDMLSRDWELVRVVDALIKNVYNDKTSPNDDDVKMEDSKSD